MIIEKLVDSNSGVELEVFTIAYNKTKSDTLRCISIITQHENIIHCIDLSPLEVEWLIKKLKERQNG